MILEENHIPLKRPHFHIRKNHLFFLISKRPYVEFSPEELNLWNNLDGQSTIGELSSRTPKANNIIKKFWKLEIIELVPKSPKDNRKKVLIVEPHMDDAILSVGGIMWQTRDECEYSVVSLTGVSNFTSYFRLDRDYFDIDAITKLRRQESNLVMRVLGGRHTVLDKKDAPLRYQGGNWSLEWYRKNIRSITAFQNHSVNDSEVESWKISISSVFEKTNAEEIWIPLGLGTSVDHETTRNACIWALMQHPEVFDRSAIFFYHDVPYAMNFPWHIKDLLSSLRHAGATLERVENDISDALEMKQRLLAIFASQFKMSYMGPKVKATAVSLGQNGETYDEPLIKMTTLPQQINQLDLFSGRKNILQLVQKLEKWRPANQNSKRITILCPMGVGHWENDMGILLSAFPSTIFEIHMTSDATDETQRFKSPRLKVLPVYGQASEWLRRILKLIFTPTGPIIIFTGNQSHFQKYSPLIRVAFGVSQPLTAIKPDYLCKAIQILQESETTRECSK